MHSHNVPGKINKANLQSLIQQVVIIKCGGLLREANDRGLGAYNGTSKNSLGIRERASGGSGTESWKSKSSLARRPGTGYEEQRIFKMCKLLWYDLQKSEKFQVCSSTNFHKQTPMQLNAQISSTCLPKGPCAPIPKSNPPFFSVLTCDAFVNFDYFCTLYTETDRVCAVFYLVLCPQCYVCEIHQRCIKLKLLLSI